MTRRKLILLHHRSPGDIICMTALVRDIKLTYGDEFQLDVETTSTDLWRHNPHIDRFYKPKQAPRDALFIRCRYDEGINKVQKQETIHFCTYFHRDFEKQYSMPVPVHYPYGDLHLSEEERTVPLIDQRYWVVVAGGKTDATVKVWHAARFQELVNRLTAQGIPIVQAGGNDKTHFHPKLDNVLNLVGQTNLRDMLRLIYHSSGVICGVTFAMHAAAALQKPCVVIAGGREQWFWEAYVRENRGLGGVAHLLTVPHRYLHTIGLLDCCKIKSCWRNKVVKINKDNSLCKQPIYHPDQAVPACMDMITVDMVEAATLSYYYDRTIVADPETQVAKDVAAMQNV